jgi:hypothetical protein
MIKYFMNSGDENVSKMFTPYLWGEHGFSTLFEDRYANKQYGNDLKLLLIKYYIEGKFDINGPESIKVNNYLKKSRDIGVDILVPFDKFHYRNEFERREFIVDTSMNAISLVKEKLVPRKLDINFDLLSNDLIQTSQEYLKYPLPIGV